MILITAIISMMIKVLPLYDRKDNLLDYAIIDECDFQEASKYKWRRERYQRKDGTFRDYAYARINKVRTRLHHFILGKPTKDENVIDHIDHDGLNDMRSNLREATGKQNAQNALKPYGRDYIGVEYKNHYWYSYCGGIYLGRYMQDEEAAIAHDHAAVRIYGNCALTNGFESRKQPDRVPGRSDRDLPIGVTKIKHKTKPYLAQANSKFIGHFASIEEAHDAYINSKVDARKNFVDSIKSLPILRDKEGNAIIKLRSNNKKL